jgi:hypothetical protein
VNWLVHSELTRWLERVNCANEWVQWMMKFKVTNKYYEWMNEWTNEWTKFNEQAIGLNARVQSVKKLAKGLR